MIRLFVLFTLLTMFILFHIPTVLNEERVLTELHGGDYLQYKNRVSRFIPNIFIYKKAEKDTYLDIRLQRVQQVMIEAVLLIILYEAIIFLN